MSGRYDNSAYWRTLHLRHPGALRAVGHPGLSEAANRLKYESEADTVLTVLNDLIPSLATRGEVRFLDIGAGTGFWTTLLKERLEAHGLDAQAAALDLSRDALDALSARMTGLQAIEADLKTARPGALAGSFDLVTAMYCLHHLVRRDEYRNALDYAAACVGPGGWLLIMDPVLREPYSPFYGVDESTWLGNGIPRALGEMDAMLQAAGFRRTRIEPAVSFLLNGPIEASTKERFERRQAAWVRASSIYAREWLTRAVAPVLRRLDRNLKRNGASGSSSLCVYHRSE